MERKLEALQSRSTQSEPHPQVSRYRPLDQPADIIHVDGALLKLDTLAKLSGLTVSTLYRAAKKGDLVLSKRGTRCTRVKSEDARAYLQRLAGGAQ